VSIVINEEPVLFDNPRIFHDNRGLFHEMLNLSIDDLPFMQDIKNIGRTVSSKGTLRGLHYQLPHEMGKFVTCTKGAIWDVVVDIRVGSPRFKNWSWYPLSAQNQNRLWVPRGFAHGYIALEDETEVMYFCDEAYYPEDSLSIRWNDPTLRIKWPKVNGGDVILSEKDSAAPSFKEMRDADALPLRTWR
jgi:dTDP-4-dehydrorhamnose 3,5-epimerase